VRVFPLFENEYFVASQGYWVLDFNVSNSKSGSLTSERTLSCSAKELESKGLKLLVNVTPVFPSMVTGVPVAPEAAPTDAATIPIVRHDRAVSTTPIFLYIFFLYIDSVQPAFADFFVNRAGPY
jgi:hypothetical protein